ncbi:hypothetical protein DUI87_12339 [Hirundo rustica rustica]|uniref:Uncharacterized protein n=1 Tax=Hirundo rustica rustica TaxID=333673 RepID=A0A3M0KBS7_HIRRU|nr:hypothetical protein DUI87_12339 [Hirundo rustica rustica]
MDIPGCLGNQQLQLCPHTPCKPHGSREVLRCLWDALIEQLNLNEAESEIQMLVSELIGNRTQLQHNSSGPNSGLSYDLIPPFRRTGPGFVPPEQTPKGQKRMPSHEQNKSYLARESIKQTRVHNQ